MSVKQDLSFLIGADPSQPLDLEDPARSLNKIVALLRAQLEQLGGSPIEGGPGGGGGGTLYNIGVKTDTQAFANNAYRTIFFIQNLSTSPLTVRYGGSPDAAVGTIMTYVLAGGAVQDDGLGSNKEETEYTGQVTVASSGTIRYTGYYIQL